MKTPLLQPKKNIFYFGWLILCSTFLTLLTGFLGAAPMYGAKLQGQKYWYFLSVAVLFFAFYFFGFPFIALAYLSFFVMIEGFEFASKKSKSLFFAGAASIFLSALVVVPAGWLVKFYQPELWGKALGRVSENFQRVASWNPQLQAEASHLWQQVPSGLVIFFCLSLFCALYFNQKVTFLRSLNEERKFWNLTSFKVPDFVFWIFLVSVLMAFYQHGQETVRVVGVNVFNALFFVYFLQGAAIVTRFFSFLKMGLLWKYLLLFFIITNLFLLVAVIGVIDFWADFRTMITKKMEKQLKTNG